jgi:hypothetical protein
MCQISIGCVGSGGAIVRRQSIASINTENCAGVSVIEPSTVGAILLSRSRSKPT